METRTYTILTAKQEEVMKKLNRLAKKAKKYDVPFYFSEGEPYAITKNQKNENGYVVENKYEVYDLTINSEVIKKNGYTVLAHLEHSATGNIVNVFEGELQKEWISRDAFCEHCNANHNLKYTFMVSNGKEIKQVGRSCLKEYCGIDPQMIGIFNAFYDEIEEDTADGYDWHEPIDFVYDATEVLAASIEITKEQGYIRSDEYNSNKGMLIKKISMSHPSEKAIKEAEAMGKEILAMDIDTAVETYLNNVQTRLKGMYCKGSDFGYFAYAPTAFAKYIEKKARKERIALEKATLADQSDYVGKIGERASFELIETRLLTSFPTAYGTTFLYRFIDTNGNVLIWFASSPMKDENVKHIKATVKAHSEREGVKQTILTRVKVA